MTNLIEPIFFLTAILFPIIFLFVVLTRLLPPFYAGKKSKLNDIEYRSKFKKKKHKGVVRTTIHAEKRLHFELSYQTGDARQEEFQTGDTHFDENIYITSDDPHFHRALEISPQLRDTVLAFMPLDQKSTETNDRVAFRAVHNRFGRMWVDYDTPRHISDEDIEILGRHSAELLGQFNEQLVQHPAPSAALKRDPFIWLTRIFQSVCYSLAFAVIITLFIDEYHPDSFNIDVGKFILWSLFVTVLSAIPIYGITYLLFHRSSRWQGMMKFLLFFGLFGLFMASLSSVNWYNRHGDTEQITYQTIVINKRISRRKRKRLTRNYYIYVADWDQSGDIRWKVDSRTDYDAIEIGQPVTLHGHSGKLGIRWVKQVDY